MFSESKGIAPVIIICLLIINLFTSARTREPEFIGSSCPNTTTFAPNSIYQKNLKLLLSVLSSNATRPNGFYNTTTGTDDPGNEVYGLFLCRGDVTATTCQQCVNAAIKELHDECPMEKVSLIRYEECLLRYSNVPIFSTVDTSPVYFVWNTGNVSEPNSFMQALDSVTGSLIEEVASGGSDKKFGTKEVEFAPFQIIYTLAQCTPDLSTLGCKQCLTQAVLQFPNCCGGIGKQSIKVVYPSCFVRYQLYPFYNSQAPPPPPPPPPASQTPPASTTEVSRKGGVSSVVIVAIVVPIVLSILLLLSCWLTTRRPKKNPELVPEEDADMSTQEFMQFDLLTIREATSNFAIDNKLGEGGFGEVYKGTLQNRQRIAVKRLSRSSRQGAIEFKTEVLLVAKLQHRNLVKLLGFCLEGEEKLLVYEFLPNKSLDHFIFDPEKRGLLDWSIRYKIVIGIARGMLYLHEDSRLRIIHRDLKASNILLDGNLNPKISDFGLAKIFGVDQTRGNTSRIMGTYGYMAPEYALNGQYSIKSDVYSLGVLVLEILTGKKTSCFSESGEAADLLSYAWQHWRDGRPFELLDSNLKDSFSPEQVRRCIHIGLLCVQEDPNERPTMQSIVLMLNSYSISLATPQRPGFYLHSRTQPHDSTISEFESDNSAVNQVLVSVNEASITDVYPR